MPVFQTEVIVDCSPSDAMQFFRNPANAIRVSPPDMDLEFENPPEFLTDGCSVTFLATSFGTRHRATHRISIIDEFSFREEQTDGPLRSWQHTHRFEATDDGRTRIVDEIEFTPPGGLIGLMVTEDRVRAKLTAAFEYQQRELRQILGKDEG